MPPSPSPNPNTDHEAFDERSLTFMATRDCFHDDYAIDRDEHPENDDDEQNAFVADGFRHTTASPALPHPASHNQPSLSSASPRLTSCHTRRIDNDMSEGRRSSIRKSMSGSQNPFASAEDDADFHVETAERFAPYPSVRPLSSASSNIYAQTHSMHIDSTGPSHPYTMYQQETDLRRNSNATTSTVRPSARAQPGSQPSHPYAMYPQNVHEEQDEDEDDGTALSSRQRQAIPVGFPGSLRNLQRDPDTISLFTNSEQLPPYSEYPENAAPKHNDEADEIDTAEPRAPSQAHARLLINIPPQSMSDNRSSSGSSLPQATDRLLDGEPTTPRAWREKTWKQKRKTKFCGIRLGWLLLGTGLAIFITAVVGGSIGGFIAKGKARRAKWRAQHIANANGWNGSAWNGTNGPNGPPEGAFYDAQPVPHQTAAPLPVGMYDLNLGAAEEVQNDCLPDGQAAAWDCNLFDAETLTIQINNVSNSQGAFVFPKESTGYGFGTQAPSTVLSIVHLVKDMDSPNAGDAYLFQVLYDKLVILSESTFNPSSVGFVSKRDSPAPIQKRDLVAGEKPWFCMWNGTMLEGFIYVDEGKSERPSYASSSNSTTASSSSQPSTSCKPWHDSEDEAPDSKSTACPSPEEQAANADNKNVYAGNIKLEERRIAGSPSPYCQQMQVLDNGIASPVIDPESGDPILIQLQENDPTAAAYKAASMQSRKKRRGLVTGSCHCQWFSV